MKSSNKERKESSVADVTATQIRLRCFYDEVIAAEVYCRHNELGDCYEIYISSPGLLVRFILLIIFQFSLLCIFFVGFVVCHVSIAVCISGFPIRFSLMFIYNEDHMQ